MATIAIAAPVRPQPTAGNHVTGSRWAHLLEAEGHQVLSVAVDEPADALSAKNVADLGAADLLIALHARRSAAAVRWWRTETEHRPLVVAMTGTDLYADLPDDATTRHSVDVADQLIVLQAEAVRRLSSISRAWGDKAAVVHQSVAGPHPAREPVAGEFRVVVLAHLRPVKDPLLAARAARQLGADSPVSVHHAGGGVDGTLVAEVRCEDRDNPRYRWYGELDGPSARGLLASADVLACTSISEGGANVVTEALALGVPVIGTRIDGNVGLLGDDYPGLVPVGDAVALAELFDRLVVDRALMAELQRRTDERRELADPATEQAMLATLVDRLLTAKNDQR